MEEKPKKSLWQRWKIMMERFGNIWGGFILLLLYFTLFAIPGIFVSLFKDVLQIKKKKKSYWIEKEKKGIDSLEEGRSQGQW